MADGLVDGDHGGIEVAVVEDPPLDRPERRDGWGRGMSDAARTQPMVLVANTARRALLPSTRPAYPGPVALLDVYRVWTVTG